jgi:hypothetical protein
MMRHGLLPILLFACVAPFGRAEEHPATATAPLSTVDDAAEVEITPSETVQRQLKYAETLERDGYASEAVRVREEALELAKRERLLARKRARLEALQKEVDQLRKSIGEGQSVRIRLLAISVDRTRLGDLADEFDRLFSGIVNRPGGADLPQNPEANATENHPLRPACNLQELRTDSPLFQELKRRRAIKFLENPTLITLSQQPATYHSGKEFDAPECEQRPNGTWGWKFRRALAGFQMTVLPKVLGDGRIELHVELQQSSPWGFTPAFLNVFHPITDRTSATTQVRVDSGQTLSLGGSWTIGESERFPTAIAQAVIDVVQFFCAAENGPRLPKFDLKPVLMREEECQTMFFVSAQLIDTLPKANPIPLTLNDAEHTAFPQNAPLEGILYFLATPGFRVGR